MDFLSLITPEKMDMLILATMLAAGLFVLFLLHYLWKNRGE